MVLNSIEFMVAKQAGCIAARNEFPDHGHTFSASETAIDEVSEKDEVGFCRGPKARQAALAPAALQEFRECFETSVNIAHGNEMLRVI